MSKEVYMDAKNRRYELMDKDGMTTVLMFTPGSSFPKVYNFESRMTAIGAMGNVVRLED